MAHPDRRVPQLALFAVLLGATACQAGHVPDQDPAAVVVELEPAPAPTVEAPTPGAPEGAAPAQPDGDRTPLTANALPGNDSAAADYARVMGLMQQATTEMRRAADAATGADDCERGYNSTVAAEAARRRVLAENEITRDRPMPEWDVAPRARFLEICAALPAPAQRCTIWTYKVDHREQCEAAKNELSMAQQLAAAELLVRRLPDSGPAAGQ